MALERGVKSLGCLVALEVFQLGVQQHLLSRLELGLGEARVHAVTGDLAADARFLTDSVLVSPRRTSASLRCRLASEARRARSVTRLIVEIRRQTVELFREEILLRFAERRNRFDRVVLASGGEIQHSQSSVQPGLLVARSRLDGCFECTDHLFEARVPIGVSPREPTSSQRRWSRSPAWSAVEMTTGADGVDGDSSSGAGSPLTAVAFGGSSSLATLVTPDYFCSVLAGEPLSLAATLTIGSRGVVGLIRGDRRRRFARRSLAIARYIPTSVATSRDRCDRGSSPTRRAAPVRVCRRLEACQDLSQFIGGWQCGLSVSRGRGLVFDLDRRSGLPERGAFPCGTFAGSVHFNRRQMRGTAWLVGSRLERAPGRRGNYGDQQQLAAHDSRSAHGEPTFDEGRKLLRRRGREDREIRRGEQERLVGKWGA